MLLNKKKSQIFCRWKYPDDSEWEAEITDAMLQKYSDNVKSIQEAKEILKNTNDDERDILYYIFGVFENISYDDLKPKMIKPPNLKKLLNADMVKEYYEYRYEEVPASNILLQISN
jgi:predicted helicase